MSLAQKFRGFITSTASAVALATLLTVIPAFNNNATAQEPRATTVSTSAPAAIPPELQKRMDQANQGIIKNIEEAKSLADQAGRAARGEIIDGKESEHTIEAQARSHSLKSKQIAFFVYKGQANEGLTGKQVIEKLTSRFSSKKITDIKPYLEPGGENTVIGFYVEGHLIGPFPLDKTAVQGADQAADLFLHPEKLPKDTALLKLSPELH